mmetsp:Transcript_45433/g.53204  ORF Transcript_45433/g.53204 Transcript_45433/m.53204 type:complete len:101 (-) Transcript_45433:324-626(-)
MFKTRKSQKNLGLYTVLKAMLFRNKQLLYGCLSPLFQNCTVVKGNISQIILEVNVSELTDSNIFLSGQDRLTNIALIEKNLMLAQNTYLLSLLFKAACFV